LQGLGLVGDPGQVGMTSWRNLPEAFAIALRPTASTASTPASRRHSRSTPCPTMPLAPNRIIFIADSDLVVLPVVAPPIRNGVA